MKPKKTEYKPEDSPIPKKIVAAVLKNLGDQELEKERRQVINTDLIPRVSEKILKPYMLKERQITPEDRARTRVLVKPNPRVPKNTKKPARKLTKKLVAKPSSSPTKPRAPELSVSGEGKYGKIDPLIRDPNVTTIECPGAEKRIIIITIPGQRMFTKIQLNPIEIKTFLQQIAYEARIPLLEGVFKAAVEDFIVSAVVSDSLGTKFVIKKEMPEIKTEY
mgnify:CR=1 FL=1